MLCPSTNVLEWYKAHHDEFKPPICNKLLHKGQMSVMFVGGPNTRTDFHIDQSSEFFWMIKGNMELPIIQQGKRRVVKIREGEVFLLPRCIPHSPQRPENDSLGLVIERRRSKEDNELDGLRWYADFAKCDEILWERYFYCDDLGRDLVPVVEAFKASDEFKTGKPTGANMIPNPPVKQDMQTIVPDPFNLKKWIEEHRAKLSEGKIIPLFRKPHPDKEVKVVIMGGKLLQDFEATEDDMETFIYQLEGSCKVDIDDKMTDIPEGSCVVVNSGTQFAIEQSRGSIGMIIQHRPTPVEKTD